jgi:hypothetical protein
MTTKTRQRCIECGGHDPCPRCSTCCDCYCSKPSYGDPAYTGICQGCGGYEECYCNEP